MKRERKRGAPCQALGTESWSATPSLLETAVPQRLCLGGKRPVSVAARCYADLCSCKQGADSALCFPLALPATDT